MSRVVPITETNVSTVITRNTAAVDDDCKEDEAKHGEDLDYTEHEFDCDDLDKSARRFRRVQKGSRYALTFSVALDTEELDNDQGAEEDGNPNPNVV